MDNALMRYVGQDPASASVPVYLRWALTKSALLSTVAAIVIYLLRNQFADWFDAPMLDSVLPGIALAIPPFTVAFVLAGFMKGIRKPVSACFLENGSIALFTSVILVCLNYFTSDSLANAGWALAGAAWIVFAQGAWQIQAWFKQQIVRPDDIETDRSAFNSSSNTFFVMSIAQFMQQTIVVLIAGWLLSNVDLGLFKAAERVALLISFVLFVINAVLPPRFASLYRRGDLVGLVSLARRGALTGLLLASPLLFFCMFLPDLILGVIGPDFAEAALLLQIIALAQTVNVATGSVGFILNMTGNELIMRNITISCNLIGVSIFFVLIPMYGALGAAIALANIIVFQNLIALFYVQKSGIKILTLRPVITAL
jgi:O-antigen/teichoic acid export membrane protein